MQHPDASNLLRAEAELVLEESRRQKAEKTKTLGSPIEIPGKALGIEIRGNNAWIAENTAVARKLDLETGKTLQLFRGHSAPVTSLAFFDRATGSGVDGILITGSWDKTIKLWDTETKECLSTTPAHTDFVKALLVIPSCHLLVSAGSDKVIRLWDLSTCQKGQPLRCVGSISAHTRPAACLCAHEISDTECVLYTADTMGIIKVWKLTKEADQAAGWRSTLQEELTYHRTRINEMLYGHGQLWTASSDETVRVIQHPTPAATSSSPSTKPIPPITHPVAVKAILPLSLTPLSEPYVLTGAGDIIRVYDVSSLDEPELLCETDAHWHDVTALRLWMRHTPIEGNPGLFKREPWIVSASLDGTIRKWRLAELLNPPAKSEDIAKPVVTAPALKENTYKMSEEEERELAELMAED
ncbi:WD40 repeat-like protein [Laetiporus sulphureus 93-53]|uniref:WD40 repeat-like protein n=1 Tax=Laetiporus sulphureus 93-53 TaxID=1314785 RepID=A0A165H9Q0_9APHY|nr:WD40 repeat-like protein [Laetiporus sulphureus 93-53]KZT11436.1 WD40 repeat-like protein [Laetiporus sulphureus 93-53]